MRGHWMTGDGIPAAFSFPQRGAILLAADPNTWWVRGREPPEPNVGIESEKKGGKKRKEEKKRCTSPSSEAVKAARSRSQGREAAGKGCVTSTERGAQGGRAAVRAEPLSATAPRHRHFSYCYLQASLHCLCSSQGWVTRSRSLRAQIRPQTPKEKTKQGRGAEPRKRGLSRALLQRSRPSLPAPGGIASLQIPPRGQLPGSRGGRSSAPRAAPQPRGGRTSQGADAAQEPPVFVRVHRAAGGPAAQQDALGWRRPAAQRSPHHRCPLATAALRFLIRGLRRDLPWMRPPLLLANEPHARPPPPAPAGGRGSDVL